MTAPTPPAFVTSSQLAAMLGVSKSTICRWRLSGALPGPVFIGPNRSVCLWSASVIAEWIAGGCQFADPARAGEQLERSGSAQAFRRFNEPERCQETGEAAALFGELNDLLDRIEAIDYRRSARSAWIEHAREEVMAATAAATAASEPATQQQAPYEDEE
ncbi:MAG: hypothetical protein JXB62_13670 [Pirellulales bacterium]|nr:hypothetical protein [Pirellulales bacterium]